MRNRLHTTIRLFAPLFLAVMGCKDGGEAGDTDQTGPQPAPLAEPSSPCPTISGTGEYTFMVDGEERTAWIGLPDPAEHSGPRPMLFAFHGLTNVGFDAAAQLVSALGLDDLVDSEGVIVVAPRAPATSLVIAQVQLWGILTEESKQADLTFVDDMRSCLADQAEVDLYKVHAFGFSGGALWTSVLAMDRADVFASAVTLSGGVDVAAASGLQFPVLDWREPAENIPVAVMNGGPTDQWPGGGLVVIDFHDASASLAQHLLDGGHTVATCEHTRGHNVPPEPMWTLGRRWMLRHSFGEPSPWATGDGFIPDGCVGPTAQ